MDKRERRVRSQPEEEVEAPVTAVRRTRAVIPIQEVPSQDHEDDEVDEVDDESSPDEQMEGETEDQSCERIIAKYKAKAKSPLKAIRAMCVNCMGGYVRMVGRCTAPSCPLYLFRFGHNPFGKHRK